MAHHFMVQIMHLKSGGFFRMFLRPDGNTVESIGHPVNQSLKQL